MVTNMAEISEYERVRLKNIEENRRMLCQLGLLSKDCKPSVPRIAKPAFVKKPIVKKKKTIENGDPLFLPGRRSLRTSNSVDTDDSDFTDSINGEYSGSEGGKEKPPKRPNVYGEIKGIVVGEVWETRMECSRAGVHRPTVAGIHPGPKGAYSIALSGGYEDNYDGGESFTYTGAGGRDLKGTKTCPKNLRTGPQVKDQTLDGANGSLATSVETRKPVRVIRGYKSSSLYAPEFGYRYDGLYQVENYWTAKGQSGHLVYKFALKRCSDQDPPPWTFDDDDDDDSVKTTPVKENPNELPASKDESQESTMNPFVQMGEKLSIEELHSPVHAEGDLSDSLVNGKLLSPKKLSSELSSHFKVSSTDERQSNIVTPEKSNVESKSVDIISSISKSPKKTISKNSPIKTTVNETIPKSPVKMMASNQSLGELTTPLKEGDHDNSSTGLVQRKINDSKGNSTVIDESGDSESPVKHNNIPENGKLVCNTSPDIFEGSSPSYLKSRRRSRDHLYNSGRDRGKKRSPSPDDFAKICDELCNELPKIEKVKRLRFSFENFADNDLQFSSLKTRRKRVSRTPRKSSLIMSNDSNEMEQKSNQDLLFSKYVEFWLSTFSFTDSDYLGWEDYSGDFEGWTDQEIFEAKKYTSSFSDFMFKCNENSSFSSCEENGWAGWDDVSRRSLVLNGFLLEEISRNRKSFDSDETDVPEEFLGFQQNN